MRPRYSEELLALPTQPAAAEQVLRLVADPRTSTEQLAVVVESDPALAARVMRLANSPYYGAPRRVCNTSHAIAILGRDTIRGITASAACSFLDGRVDIGPDGFWRHAVSTAAACSVVADHVGYSRADAFSVGLLHDIGAVLLHRRDPIAFEAAQAKATVSEIVAAEIEAFGMTHAQVGADALDAWAFPPAFVEAVALHQHGVEEPTFALGRILRVGEALALQHHRVPGYPTEARFATLLASVRLSVDHLDTLRAEMEAQLERLVDALAHVEGSR